MIAVIFEVEPPPGHAQRYFDIAAQLLAQGWLRSVAPRGKTAGKSSHRALALTPGGRQRLLPLLAPSPCLPTSRLDWPHRTTWWASPPRLLRAADRKSLVQPSGGRHSPGELAARRRRVSERRVFSLEHPEPINVGSSWLCTPWG